MVQLARVRADDDLLGDGDLTGRPAARAIVVGASLGMSPYVAHAEARHRGVCSIGIITCL